jgi:AraC-like DNA-binding protein
MRKIGKSMRENPENQADVFSALLELMNAHTVMSGGLVAGGAWAIDFPATPQLKFWGIRRGSAWIDTGNGPALPARAGDIFLFRAPGPHVLASSPGAPRTALDALAQGRGGAILQHGAGDDFYMIGGKVALDAGCEPLLFGGLPAVVRIDGGSDHARPIHWILERLVEERDAALPGSEAACNGLAHLMFIHILRACLQDPVLLGSGRLRAVGDRKLAPALRHMHTDPGRGWRLAELAAACAMSRAGFARHFKAVSGTTPLHYLSELRMRLAQKSLRSGKVTVAQLAGAYGYASESAFSHAFKRVLGHSPKTSYRADADPE